MKLLHVDSSILGDNSVSRRLSAAIVEEFRRQDPGLVVTRRDLADEPLRHLTPSFVAAQQVDPGQHSPELQKDLADSSAALDEFLAAEVVVIGAPMYNFTVPSTLKAWVDRVCVAGRTFRYTAGGAEGLAGGKKVVIASSRGGIYGPGSPYAANDHQETYLKSIFGFLGVTDLEIVRAEGVAMGPEKREEAVAAAERQIATLKIA